MPKKLISIIIIAVAVAVAAAAAAAIADIKAYRTNRETKHAQRHAGN